MLLSAIWPALTASGTIQERFAFDINMVLRCSGTHAIETQPPYSVTLRQLQNVSEIAHRGLIHWLTKYASHLSLRPKPLHEFEIVKKQAIEAASDTADAYIQGWVRNVICVEEIYQGRMSKARASAQELIQVGRRLNDPHSTALGLGMLGWVALVSNSYAEALEYSEQVLPVAVTPWDRESGNLLKGCALVLLGRTEEGASLMEGQRSRAVTYGYLHTLRYSDAIIGVCKVLQGDIGRGIRLIEEAILRREKEGDRGWADAYRGILSDVYLQIIGGNEKPPFSVLLKNLPILVKVTLTAPSRIRAMATGILENPRYDPRDFG